MAQLVLERGKHCRKQDQKLSRKRRKEESRPEERVDAQLSLSSTQACFR